ncbi:MAG TPA: cytochrome c [Polyangiaceae bacterium]
MNRPISLRPVKAFLVALAAVSAGSCGESSSSPEVVDYALVSKSSAGLTVNATLVDPSLAATAGDVLRLGVVGLTTEGIAVPAPEGARIAWSGLPRVVVSDLGAPSPVMGSDDRPSGIFIDNATRFGKAGDEVLVGLLDASAETLGVTAELSGVPGPPRVFTVQLSASKIPAGDIDRGQHTFAENCASCHGTLGTGAPRLTPAPVAMTRDAGWTAPVFAVGTRIGMNARGVPLHPPMPTWLAEGSARGELLTTRDFADIYAFLNESSVASLRP